MIQLRPHQQEAMDNWISAGTIGTIKSPTASGKSHVALKAIEINPDSIYIIVHTTALQDQWAAHIKNLDIEYGLLGNGNNDITKPVTIAIVNSARDIKIKCRLMIFDEVHHALSHENYKVIQNATFSSFMGLSASPEKDLDHIIWNEYIQRFPIVFDYPLEDAIDDGVVSPFEEEGIPCKLTAEEQILYDKYTATVKKVMPMYGDFRIALMAARRGAGEAACSMLSAIQQRKMLLAKSQGKTLKALEMIESDTMPKCIVFSESVDTVDWLYNNIKHKEKFVYHSKTKKKERAKTLDLFRASPNGVLLSAKALDEGLDVPSCSAAIVISGTSSKRQYVQRIGRILRPQEGKLAKLYELFIEGSVDEKWYKKRHSKKRVKIDISQR